MIDALQEGTSFDEERSIWTNFLGRASETIAIFAHLNLYHNDWLSIHLNNVAQRSVLALQNALLTITVEPWMFLQKCALPLFSPEVGRAPSAKVTFMNVIINSFIDPLHNAGLKTSTSYAEKFEKWLNKTLQLFRLSNVKNPGAAFKASQELSIHLADQPWVVELAGNDVQKSYRKSMQSHLNNLFDSATELTLKGLSFTGVFLNLWNVVETPLPTKWNLNPFSDSDSTRKSYTYLSNMAYLGQATIGMFSGAEANLQELVNGNKAINAGKGFYDVEFALKNDMSKALLRLGSKDSEYVSAQLTQSLSTEEAKILSKSLYGSLRVFRVFMGLMGTASLIASGFELVPIYHDLFLSEKNHFNKAEYTWTAIKGTALVAWTSIGFYQILLSTPLIAGVAWVTPVFWLAGLVYLVSSFVLMFITRDEIDHWLEWSRFGHDDDLRRWQLEYDTPTQRNEAAIAELGSLQDVLLAPIVYTKALIQWDEEDEQLPIVSNTEDGPIQTYTIPGYWLVLYLPGVGWDVEIVEMKGETHVTNDKLANINPVYLSKEQFQSIAKTGLGNSFDDTISGVEKSTGVYLYQFH